MCPKRFPQVDGGQVEGLACTDLGGRTTIIVNENYIHSLDNDNVKVPWEINQLTKFIHYIITKQLQLDSHNGMFCS